MNRPTLESEPDHPNQTNNHPEKTPTLQQNKLSEDPTTQIRMLNDMLRGTGVGGTVVITHTVAHLEAVTRQKLIDAIRAFDDFSEDNDPYGEHDFGMVTCEGQTYYWKIDYYDQTLQLGSPDPTDPNVTQRVLTIMHRSEY